MEFGPVTFPLLPKYHVYKFAPSVHRGAVFHMEFGPVTFFLLPKYHVYKFGHRNEYFDWTASPVDLRNKKQKMIIRYIKVFEMLYFFLGSTKSRCLVLGRLP